MGHGTNDVELVNAEGNFVGGFDSRMHNRREAKAEEATRNGVECCEYPVGRVGTVLFALRTVNRGPWTVDRGSRTRRAFGGEL